MNELLEQQLAGMKKPKVVKQPVRVGQSYNVTLQKLVKAVREDINRLLVPALKQLEPEYRTVIQDAAVPTQDAWSDQLLAILRLLRDKWESPAFREVANQAASQFVRTASAVNAKKFAESVSVGVDVFGNSPALQNFLTLATQNNASLITSIPSQYLDQVQNIVLTNVRAGTRSSAIVSQLTERFGVTQKRAKMIARDQTAKINGDLVKERQTAVGFEFFQWMDSDDERVRDRHAELAERVTEYGKGIYRWDNPPLSNKGVPIIPGQDYQCRCNARPVSRAEVEANQKAGRTRPGVKR